MPSPPVQVFLTTIASQPALRQRQEHLLRILQVKKIKFESFDLASNEEAKKLWRRKAPPNNQQLPGILVGGRVPGTYADFEDAVEHEELDQFFKLNEPWEEHDLDGPSLSIKPIGVPGVASPQQITNQKPSFSISPSVSPLKQKPKTGEEKNAGTLLEDTSLDGVDVTEDELAALVSELGLEGDAAGDLVKGLSTSATVTAAPKEVDVEPITVKTHDEPGHTVIAGTIVPPPKDAADEKVVDVEATEEVVEAKIEPQADASAVA